MKAREAALRLMQGVSELLSLDRPGPEALERLGDLRRRYAEPLHRALDKLLKYQQGGRDALALVRMMEQYFLFFETEPLKRDERRKEIERLKVAVQRSLLPRDTVEGETQELLADIRRWMWRTRVDDQGRIVFSGPDGASIPAKGEITQKSGPVVIEQAAQAQRPYSDALRPRDKRGEPGGLIVVRNAKRLLVVGDLHGRYDNLERILRDRDNLSSVIKGQTQLVFTGDAVHPQSSLYNDDAAYEDSFAVMLLIMTLKAENPDTVHYIVGNHDNCHVGGRFAGRGDVRQDEAFERLITKKFGAGVLERYKEFVLRAPLAVKANLGKGNVLLLHATVPRDVRCDEDLTDILIYGRQSKMMQDILWNRAYSDEALDTVGKNMSVTLVVSGHTTPDTEHIERYGLELIAPPVFAHYRNRQIIVNAQNNKFGYLDLDLTQDMPARVMRLRAPGGMPAFRVIGRVARHSSQKEGAA